MSQEAPITEVVWSFEALMKDWGLPKLVAQLSEAKRTLMAARKERAALVLSGSARAENSRKQRLAVLDVLNAVHRQQAALMEGLKARCMLHNRDSPNSPTRVWAVWAVQFGKN